MFHYPLNEIILGPFTIVYFPQLHSTVHTYCAAVFISLYLKPLLPLSSSTSWFWQIFLDSHDSTSSFILRTSHFPYTSITLRSFPISWFYLRPWGVNHTPRRHMYHSNLSLRVALRAPLTHDPSPAARVWCGICLCAVVVTACQAVRRCHAGQVHGPASEKLHCHTVYTCPSALQPWEKVYPRE